MNDGSVATYDECDLIRAETRPGASHREVHEWFGWGKAKSFSEVSPLLTDAPEPAVMYGLLTFADVAELRRRREKFGTNGSRTNG